MTRLEVLTRISNCFSTDNQKQIITLCYWSLVNRVRLVLLSNCAHEDTASIFMFYLCFFGLERRCHVCARGLGEYCLSGKAEQEKLERAAATQNMDRAFTWPCALWVRQVAASSTGPPTWASHCCYCRRRHRSVCCRWEACRHKTTLTSLPTLGWVHPRAVGDCWHQWWATG